MHALLVLSLTCKLIWIKASAEKLNVSGTLLEFLLFVCVKTAQHVLPSTLTSPPQG